MLESIHFQNFKALRDTTLRLGHCTILVGPNGSGKSTVLEALRLAQGELGHSSLAGLSDALSYDSLRWARGEREGPTPDGDSAEVPDTEDPKGEIKFTWRICKIHLEHKIGWSKRGGVDHEFSPLGGAPEVEDVFNKQARPQLRLLRQRIRVFSLKPTAIAAPAPIQENVELGEDGSSLAGVLDDMRDTCPERFDAINAELGQWLPEFDRILFAKPDPGLKSLLLRTRTGQHQIPAAQLSDGTLIALALLTLAHLPEPPSVVGIEDPDRGIHPRLLRRVQDAIYRLSHPKSCGDGRRRVQVIATTHSPYFLDLFRDHPEEIVVANKNGLDVQFKRVTDRPDFNEVIGDAPLGEAWYRGVFGGVPHGS